VNNERPSREQLIELAKTDPEAIADLVLMLWDRVEKLEEIVATMESKISSLESNSRSSSKPPSTDKGNFTNPPKPKSLREKTGRKPGGQKGHRGNTLEQSDCPDHIIVHPLPEEIRCEKCGVLFHTDKAEKLDTSHCECRQVFELPAIKIEVIEHRAESVFCPNCNILNRAEFPLQVKAPVQYGSQVQATALYLGTYHLVPYQRLSEIFTEVFNCPLSPGTLANFVKRGGQKASESMEAIREALIQSKIAHADETGCTLNGKRHWLHVFCTTKLTCFHIDEKRGYDAMERMGLLPQFRGSLVHDCLGAYFKYLQILHFLCIAHIQRELIFVHEELDQSWAADMIKLLLEAKKISEQAEVEEKSGRTKIPEKTRQSIKKRYDKIIEEGKKINPEPPPRAAGKRGRVKRSKPLNLLIRMADRKEEIMGYFDWGHVPYDNNQAERDLRMMKVREKISGTFRAQSHAQAFCDIRSIISSARKQSRLMLGTLTDLIELPKSLGKKLAKGK